MINSNYSNNSNNNIKLSFFYNNKYNHNILEKISYTKLKHIQKYINNTYNLSPKQYYLINLDSQCVIYNEEKFNNVSRIEIIPRIKGGFIKKAIKGVTKFIFKIFDPIVKPLRGIANAVLMLLKAIVYISMLLLWMIKFMIWFLTDFVMSFPSDLITLVKRISYIIFDTTIGVVFTLFKRGANKVGNLSLNAIGGWDNVPDDDEDESKTQYFKDECNNQKCYRTSDGTVPFSVIIATILCPPVGVFMEYGLFGWFNILVCIILTLCFYFPGLIYALILLYC